MKILILGLIIFNIAGGAFYLGRQSILVPSNNQKTCTLEARICPDGSTVGRSGPNCEFADCPANETATWKIYTHPDFTFKYPDNWYFENHPDFPSGNNVGFFLVGTKADHGYGDHKGNEIFAFEASSDTRSLEELKSNYYPDAVNVIVGGKPAIRTTFNLYIINYSANKKLNVVGGKQEAKKYIDQILSTFKFIN